MGTASSGRRPEVSRFMQKLELSGKHLNVQDFQGQLKKATFSCLKCGHCWETTALSVLKSLHNCPECERNSRKLRTLNNFEFRSDKQKYTRALRLFTQTVYKHNHFLINPDREKLQTSGFVLDHVYSIRDSYNSYSRTHKSKIPWLTCHPANLQLLGWKLNLQKSASSWFSPYILRECVQNYNMRHGCPFSRWMNDDLYPQYDRFARIFGWDENYDKV